MPSEFSGAHLCEFNFQCVTQPGVDPSVLFSEIMSSVQKICGSNAGVTTIGHDTDFKPTDITYRPLFVHKDHPWKEGEKK